MLRDHLDVLQELAEARHEIARPQDDQLKKAATIVKLKLKNALRVAGMVRGVLRGIRQDSVIVDRIKQGKPLIQVH